MGQAAKVLSDLLSMDGQFISGRPTPFCEAIKLIVLLCEHAEGSLRDGTLDGWQDVDVSQVNKKHL